MLWCACYCHLLSNLRHCWHHTLHVCFHLHLYSLLICNIIWEWFIELNLISYKTLTRGSTLWSRLFPSIVDSIYLAFGCVCSFHCIWMLGFDPCQLLWPRFSCCRLNQPYFVIWCFVGTIFSIIRRIGLGLSFLLWIAILGVPVLFHLSPLPNFERPQSILLVAAE